LQLFSALAAEGSQGLKPSRQYDFDAALKRCLHPKSKSPPSPKTGEGWGNPGFVSTGEDARRYTYPLLAKAARNGAPPAFTFYSHALNPFLKTLPVVSFGLPRRHCL
jgi:hypothetical protein